MSQNSFIGKIKFWYSSPLEKEQDLTNLTVSFIKRTSYLTYRKKEWLIKYSLFYGNCILCFISVQNRHSIVFNQRAKSLTLSSCVDIEHYNRRDW